MGDTILRVDDIQKFYGNKGNLTKALDHISFSVRKGEFLGIMGASGSGKTTLLNCISTIDTVTSGHIYVEEKAEARQKALRQYQEEEVRKLQNRNKPRTATKATTQEVQQPSLFDLGL